MWYDCPPRFPAYILHAKRHRTRCKIYTVEKNNETKTKEETPQYFKVVYLPSKSLKTSRELLILIKEIRVGQMAQWLRSLL